MTQLHVAAIQTAMTDDREANVAALGEQVREAAAGGAEVVLLPELFEGHYFPRRQSDAEFARARPLSGNPTVERFAALAAELRVCLPISFFERAGQSTYNSVAVIDRRGEVLGVYRKSHIPDGPGYQEKFYFRPGDTGFRVWPIDGGDPGAPMIGVGICWDQWFPEAARAMVLAGADLLLYPTAIGSEPAEPDTDTRDRWQRVMIGHAVANVCAVAAANRTGTEGNDDGNDDGEGDGALTFYGSSFICDHAGDKLAELDREATAIASAVIDVDRQRRERDNWGFFRDRRPDCYTALSRTREPES